jgi:hypothetical protein
LTALQTRSRRASSFLIFRPVEESFMAYRDADSIAGKPSNCFDPEPTWFGLSRSDKLRNQHSRSASVMRSATLSMRLFRCIKFVSQNASPQKGAHPSLSFRTIDLMAPPRTRSRVEHPSDAALRRRKIYVAAVRLSAAVSAALTGTVWAGAVTGDATRTETLLAPARMADRLTRTSEDQSDCLPQKRPTATTGHGA